LPLDQEPPPHGEPNPALPQYNPNPKRVTSLEQGLTALTQRQLEQEDREDDPSRASFDRKLRRRSNQSDRNKGPFRSEVETKVTKLRSPQALSEAGPTPSFC
jgi:hypothetical protein